ncbi:MAG: alpha/beta hydrolase [Dermatophilaceae bacterium]
MTIPVRTVGSGPHHVFCLHGWFACSTRWGSFPDYLDGERFSYHFTDNRGYGARKAEPGTYTLDEVASDVLQAADERGADTFSLVGHSMGGSAALRVLAVAPARVRKIVGIDPTGAAPFPMDESGRALFFGAPASRENRYAIVDFTTGNRLTPTWVNQVVDSSYANSTVEAYAGALEAYAGPDFLDEVKGNDTPMLVIVGEHDPGVGEAYARVHWEPHFPRCTIEVMANAGHYAPFETPVALATSIERFLAD